MYSPKIPEMYIPRLYKLAKARRRPMTRLVAEAVELYLVHEETNPISPDDWFVVTESGGHVLPELRRVA